MTEKLIDYKDFMRKDLLNKEYAQHYLDIAFEEGNFIFFRQCLLEVVKVHGGVQALADELGVTRQTVYYGLSKDGSLQADRLHTIIKYLGLEMHIKVAG